MLQDDRARKEDRDVDIISIVSFLMLIRRKQTNKILINIINVSNYK